MVIGVNEDLLQMAMDSLGIEKTAIVPAPGPMPADPAAMAGGGGGGMPMPPGMPPMPAMPADPAAAGAAPPAAAAPPPAPGAPPAAPGAPPAPAGATGAGGKAKLDPAMIYAVMFKILKAIVSIANQNGWQLPPDLILDTPPDPTVAAQADQQMAYQAQQASQGAAGVAPPAGAAAGGGAPPEAAPVGPTGMPMLDTGIAPIEGMAPEAGKQGSVSQSYASRQSKTDALALLFSQRRSTRVAS